MQAARLLGSVTALSLASAHAAGRGRLAGGRGTLPPSSCRWSLSRPRKPLFAAPLLPSLTFDSLSFRKSSCWTRTLLLAVGLTTGRPPVAGSYLRVRMSLARTLAAAPATLSQLRLWASAFVSIR